MEIFSNLKNVGGMLATVATLVYVSGYLALRARAFTLGIDPVFTLAYEGYVFAGFRFLFISLIILLILSPIILAVRSGALWMSKRVPGTLLNTGQWLLLVLLAICTLYITFRILSVNGVLLRGKNNGWNSLLERAVIGGEPAVALMFAVLFLTALSVLWLKMRLPAVNDSFTWMLGIVVTIQIFLLPIFHGSLYADRKVRVLAATPEAVKDFKEPLGIVDRTSDHVTLLGVDKNDERRLVTIKIDDLNGIPVKNIVSLKKFIQNELAHAQEKGGRFVPEKTGQEDMTSKNEAYVDKGFFKQLIDYLHVTFENIGSLGDSVVAHGQIWLVEFDTSGRPAKPRKISAVSNLAWPILDPKDQTIYAIQQDRIVQLGDDGQSITEVDKQKQWIKLFGVTEHGDVLGMIYEDGESILATLHADGKITLSPAPQSDEEQEQKSILEQEHRAYAGNRSLYVKRSTRGGRGFDVFFKRGEDVFNLSDCGDDRCGQPSFSPDFRRALYVRKSRF
ncbi:MAG: hypothetical protein ACMUIL_07300 [bacterium]